MEALQVEAEVKPLEIRREELAIRQAARVLMKDNEECIKISWDRFVESEILEHKVSPFGKINIQSTSRHDFEYRDLTSQP